jgi:hypothetical protein
MRLAAILIVLAGCSKIFGINEIPYGGPGDGGVFDDSAVDAAPAAKLQIGASMVEFDSVAEGLSSFPHEIDVTNIGDLPSGVLTTSNVGANPTDFTVSEDLCSARSLDPGKMCSFAISFTPAHAGDKTATVKIDDGTLAVSADLSGTALVQGLLLLTPMVSFGPQTVGSTSAPQNVTLTNSGQTPLHIVSATIGSDFVISSDPCMGTDLVHQNDTCVMALAFRPTLGGSRTASLLVTTDAMLNPTSASALGGTGHATVTVHPSGMGSVSSPDMMIECGTLCSAVFAAPSVVLIETPDPQSGFINWGAGCAANSNTCTVTTSVATSDIVATFQHFAELTVTVTGTGGTVTSAPAGIDCPPTCGASFPPNTPVRLTATGHGASFLSTWDGVCQSSQNQAQCNLTMNADQSASADFASDFVMNIYPGAAVDATAKITNDAGQPACPALNRVCSLHFALEPQVVTLTAVPGDCTTAGTFFSPPPNDSCNDVLDSCSASFGASRVSTVGYNFMMDSTCSAIH